MLTVIAFNSCQNFVYALDGLMLLSMLLDDLMKEISVLNLITIFIAVCLFQWS